MQLIFKGSLCWICLLHEWGLINYMKITPTPECRLLISSVEHLSLSVHPWLQSQTRRELCWEVQRWGFVRDINYENAPDHKLVQFMHCPWILKFQNYRRSLNKAGFWGCTVSNPKRRGETFTLSLCEFIEPQWLYCVCRRVKVKQLVEEGSRLKVCLLEGKLSRNYFYPSLQLFF